ncbi:MAG: winged helix-turn-helix transcriptional regulator [Phormidesmis sp.]
MPEKDDGVPLVRATLGVLGGKWTVRILWHLRLGPKRYGELRQLIPKVSEKVLIQKLRDLEENDIVAREVLSDKPLKIEYRFTEYGQTLVPVFQALCNWGEKHIERMNIET